MSGSFLINVTQRGPHLQGQAFRNRTGTYFPGVQWLRLYAPSAGSMGSMPGWGAKILYAPQQGQKIKVNF